MAGSGRDDRQAESVGRRGDETALSEEEKQMLLLEDVAASLDVEAMEDVITNSAARVASESRDGRAARVVGGRQIGLTVPAGGPAAPAATRPSPAAHMQRALTAVDARLLQVLTATIDPATRDCARLELALLARTRRCVQRQLDALPTDILLCESLAEYAESVQVRVTDLADGGLPRVHRFLEFGREVVAELSALNHDCSALKQDIALARSLLTADDESGVTRACDLACSVFAGAWEKLEESWPSSEPVSLLDELIARR